MKKSKVFLSLILFLCLNQSLVNSQTIQPVERSVGKLKISIDPRMEILSIVQLLSNYPQINRNSSYSKDILNFFEPFSSQEVVKMTDSLLKKHGFSYHVPQTFMLHLSQLPELEQNIKYTKEVILRSGGGNNLEQYRKSIKQFAETSNFQTFWNNKIPLYNQILDLTVVDIEEIDLIKVLEGYFNEAFDGYYVTISPSFIGGYAPILPSTDGKNIIYGCLSTTDMKNDIPYMDRIGLSHYVWHEFGHSFVNPLTDKYSDRVEPLNKLFEPIREDMARQAYGAWNLCVNEHIIRAINIRLYELHLGSQQSKSLLRRELRQRFIYIEPLIEKLKYFETQRDKNNITFSGFYPELLNMLDSLQKIEYWKQVNMNFKGTIADTFNEEPLAIIYPTHDLDTEALKNAQNQALQIFDSFLKDTGGGILLADTAALKTDLSKHGIMAYGTIESNLFLKHHAATFPFRVENQTIYADKEYTDKDLKLICCVPNPHNPQKGMSIYTALSNRALQGINEAFFENDFQFFNEDYILFLNHKTVKSRGFYNNKSEKWTF